MRPRRRCWSCASVSDTPHDAPVAHLLRVRITDVVSGRITANVTIPVSLVGVGRRLGARLVPAHAAGVIDQVTAAIALARPGPVARVDDAACGETIELALE
jgi:hypothetical protein